MLQTLGQSEQHLSERPSFFPHSNLIKSLLPWTFQIKQYLGCRDLLLKIPSATKEHIFGYYPTGFHSAWSWKADITDL